MRAEEVIPSVAPDDCRSFAVYGYIYSLVPFDSSSCLRVKLNNADEAEIGAVCAPEAPCRRIHEKSGVYCIAVFINL